MRKHVFSLLFKPRLNISRTSFFYLLITSFSGAGIQVLSIVLLIHHLFLPALLAHIILPVTALRISNWQRRDPLAHHLWVLLSISSFFLSVLGTLGWFITYILCSVIFKPKDVLTEYKEFITLKFTREEILKDLALEPYRRKRGLSPEKGELAPYVDILQGNDIELKLAVIEKLSLKPNYTRISMLKDALNDDNDEVRLSAAANLRKIEDRMNKKITELKREVRLQQNNDQILIELALVLDEYAYSGILDEDTTRFYQNQAIELYSKVIDINPFATESYKNLGRILLRMGRMDESIKILEQGLKINPQSQTIFLLMMEYYFNQRDFVKLREMAKKISIEQVTNEKIKQLVSWWCNE